MTVAAGADMLRAGGTAFDAVIEPADTRSQVAAAFDMLAGKRERLPRRRHDNTPL